MKKSLAAATRAIAAMGFDGGRERTRRWFPIWPRRRRRWPEERDQRGGGAVSPGAAMVATRWLRARQRRDLPSPVP